MSGSERRGIALLGCCLLVVVGARSLYGLASAAATETPVPPPTSTSAVEPTGYGTPRLLGTLEDPLITESSGLVASRQNPGKLWTHNDSGDYESYLFCVRRDGSACGRWSLGGVYPLDWEAIAAGPGPIEGVNYLFLGDIGDNARTREEITVHLVEEPLVGGSEAPTVSTLGPATSISLSYPDGPHDAETLLVHPVTGDLYIITKEIESRASVFKADAPLTSDMELREVASFRLFDNFSERTGGDISSDGKRVIISTYLDAYEKRVPPGDFDQVWNERAVRIDVGPVAQREAIAYSLDGRSIFATTEGTRAKLTAVTRN